MDRMREHSPVIVMQVGCVVPRQIRQFTQPPQQALLVSKELIRVAILWHEMWHEGLEEASRLYFNDKNPDGMIMVLEPLHKMLEKASAMVL